ncbi:Uracil DNA glycosylase superfamily protein [Stieleria neptunia]|uniref:Type-4 uracil-DNA glycosylase n=1 Tax=Stieleria neptunia TaxID=2527979 RepID=A0A518HHR7_9BACT|nr:UdgX family uracil-DNA binding protein [Stieleria neptunia]QDV40370.1 Uracil DNA glycosylase superfamily protein [Stieleria neptunia]
MRFVKVQTFDQWRVTARRLLTADVPPEQVAWMADDEQHSLFDSNDDTEFPATPTAFTVPKAFLELAKTVACHRAGTRWSLLYRTLWRLVRGERHLLQITTDDDVHELTTMRKAVTRDVHKMKAFVRFRKVIDSGDEEVYVAWHRPDHRIVRLAAPFFSRRFSGMKWSILTPDESVTWDQSSLRYGPGVPVSDAPDDDALEELWKTYYASIFNPARVKVDTMKREMPVRHWPTLPETSLIDDLLQAAPERVAAMVDQNEGFAETATHYMPERIDLESLRTAVGGCRACDLHRHATQPVFGEGSRDARIVLVGEQPGDREDLEGRPFVGSAGKLLDDALKRAGIRRNDVYLTNVVKHFKFTEATTSRGKRRLHQKPNAREVYACRPWLEAELALVQPVAILCLGATSSQALFGRDFQVSKHRGEIRATDWCERTMATWHPAAILRMPDDARKAQMHQQLIDDLRRINHPPPQN